MRYMLMMHAPRGTGEFQVSDWAPQDLKAHIDFMARLNRELTGKGELVAAEGLASPGQARVVRAAKDGVPAVTDGPFGEVKEQLAGVFAVDVDSFERAKEIAGPISEYGVVEIRQLMEDAGTEM